MAALFELDPTVICNQVRPPPPPSGILCVKRVLELIPVCAHVGQPMQDDEVGRKAFVRLKHFYTDTWVHCTSIPIDRDKEKHIMLKVRPGPIVIENARRANTDRR